MIGFWDSSIRWVRAHQGLLRWLLAAVFVASVACYLVRHLDELSFFVDLDWRFLVLLLVTHVIYLVVHAWRFLLIMRHNTLQGITFLRWFQIFILGRFLNKYMPQGGNVYRGVRLKIDYQFSYTNYTSSFVSSTWLDTILDLILTFGLTVIFEPTLRIGPWSTPVAIVAALVLVVGGPILLHLLFSRIHARARFLVSIHKILSEVLSISVENIRDAGFVSRVSLLGGLAFLITALNFYLVLQAFHISATVSVVAIFVCLRRLSLVVNLTPGNLGVQEWAYGFLGSALGIGMAQGIVASGIQRVVSYGVSSVLGTLFGGLAMLRGKGNDEL